MSIQYFPGEQEPWSWLRAAFQLVKSGAEGDILVFMPGVYEIRKTVSSLQEVRFGEPVDISMLYGDLPSDRQRQVMEQRTRRKIIVATNIAETSLTIPGVRHVIDSGLARINRYDPVRGFNTLYVEKIALYSAAQRSGRAGREAPGICIRLWSQTDQRSRSRRTQPEIFRVDLAETVLQLKMLGFADPVSFPWIESPRPTIKPLLNFSRLMLLTKRERLLKRGKDSESSPCTRVWLRCCLNHITGVLSERVRLPVRFSRRDLLFPGFLMYRMKFLNNVKDLISR